uniref:Uncharacterized protein n=1 Tax=uncultured marine virus TaxID=186617 RepID=A0A0F7L9W6_9VIRU|nr:hypothetical protein [uncultured marine virus]
MISQPAFSYVGICSKYGVCISPGLLIPFLTSFVKNSGVTFVFIAISILN